MFDRTGGDQITVNAVNDPTTVTGDTSEELVYWMDSGTDTTSPLICRFDTFSSGMPVSPNTGDIDIQPSASGVFVI